MLAPFLAVWAVLVVLAARGAWRLPGMRGLLEPHAFHLLLIAAWLCIGLHNAVRLPLEYGFDAEQHLDYIRFIVANRALPLASDGWQMFQSPLYYLLSAAFVDALQPWLDEGSVYRALRLLPVLFGALHIEVVYRCVRLCFPGESSLIRLSTAVGGFLPVSLYMSQGLGNETLAGLLTGTLILLCLRMILRADPGRFLRSAFLIGVAWGLAMLAKLTPALMAPAIAYALLQGARAERSSRAVLVSALLLVATTAALVCGWYYLRNVEAFGTPFVGGWDPERGLLWFQPPGYRYAVDLVTFGRALVWPVYSGAVGFLDGVYSTMWLDGMLGGRIYPDRATLEAALPWHPVPLVAGSLTALLPAVLMLRGAAVIAVSSSPALRLAGVCLLTYWLALAWMFLAVPNYAIAKASYTLGLLPCYALLFAAGARKWLDHPAMSRAIPAWIACWWLVACLATLSR